MAHARVARGGAQRRVARAWYSCLVSARGGVRLAELLGGLSIAEDVVNGFPHGKVVRTALLAAELARAAGLGAPIVRDALYTTLLRFLGCTGFAHEEASLYGAGDDHSVRNVMAFVDVTDPFHAVSTVGARIGVGASPAARAAAIARLLGDGVAADRHARAQCDQSRHLAQWIGASEPVVAALGFICERFDGRGSPEGAAGEAIPIATRLYHVADVAELALDRVGRAHVAEVLARRAGGALDPALCRVLLGELDRLLDLLEGPDAFARYLAAEPAPHALADEDTLDRVTEALGRFVDVKSVFFVGHSDGVARLAEGAARELGLRPGATRSLVRAAHLHDLGRLSVPNRVWDKPGALSFAEREQVRLHAYYTDRILAQTPALRAEARIASAAHERLDGHGYHRALEAAGLSPEARLLAAADAAHAMRERRPHREPLEAARVKDELSAEARRGALDATAVEAVIAALAAPSDRPRRTLRSRASLSERELEVLRLVAAGKTNKEIAVILDLSAKTVQHHVAHVYAKIGVYSRAGATLYVIEQGLSG